MSDSSNPYANAAAEKQRFIQSLENTQQGRDWNAAIARETASLQQERAQQAGIARHGSSSLVNAQDKESEEREARKGRNLNIPLQGGQPDFSKQAYYSALEEKSKQFGDSVVGGGSLNAAASFMAVGRDGTSNVLGTTHLKIDKTGQDFYLTQHEDRTYEIRTATGQMRSSGKDWDAKKSSDAAYLLSGDFLLDKKNVPLDYKPEIATGKALRIIDNDGPVDISAYHTGTMANYQAAGIKKNDAAFMSEGLSNAVPVMENTVYLSKVSSSPTEDVYHRYWVSDYGKEGVEVRDGGGQIVLSSGSNDPNVWGPTLDSRKGNESMGGKLYQIPERTVQMSEQDRLKEADIKIRDFINSPDNVAYSSGVISHEDNRDRITRGFERVMGGLSQIDSHSVKVPEIGLLNPNTNLPGGDFTKMLLYSADQSPAGLSMRMGRELIENPTGTTVGGAAIGIYGLYAMGKAAVTDPIGSVLNLPKTVPEAIVGLDEAFKSKPLQTTVALYAGGKVLKPVGSLFKKPTSVTSGKGASSGPSGKPFKPSPMPELIEGRGPSGSVGGEFIDFTVTERPGGGYTISGGGKTVTRKGVDMPPDQIRASKTSDKPNSPPYIDGFENTKLILAKDPDPIWGRIDLDKSANVPRNTKLILAKDSDPIWGRIDLDKSASVPRDSKLVLTKDLDPIWGRIGRDNSVGNPKGKSSQNTPKKTRSNGEHSKNNADSSNGMSLLLRETKTQTKPNIISAPSESISVLSDSKLSTIKTPEVFGFPLLSKQIPGSLIVGGGVGAISTNKSNFGFTNMRSNVIDSPTKNQSRTINKTKTEITQVFRQTMEQRIDPKSTSIVSVKQDIATESDTKNKRRVGPFYSLNLDAAVDSVLRVEEKSDTRVKTRMGYVTRPRTKPKTKPKPSHKSKKQFTPDNAYDRIAGSLDIKVINPRVALKNLVGK